MAAKPLPDAALLRQLLRYEHETGRLYWRPRLPSNFIGGQPACAAWNKRYSEREAFTSTDNKGYRVGAVLGVRAKAHRVIWLMEYGECPDVLDHINQDKADNRIANLQPADPEINGRNMRKSRRNKSGKVGVYLHRISGLWRAKIRHSGRYIYLGDFKSFEDACVAREGAERKFGYSHLHGK